MNPVIAHVTIDCVQADQLAAFWAGLLGRSVDDGANEYFATIGLHGAGSGGPPALMFLQVPEPKTTKNRVHLDLHAPDWPTQVERAVALGATKVAEFAEHGTAWATLLDPEGNEFDLGAGMT